MGTRRPRIAAIGLNVAQIESIRHLCGTLRPADSLTEFLKDFNLIETDVMVTGVGTDLLIERDTPHVLAIEPARFWWLRSSEPGVTGWGRTSSATANTERELTVPSSCPDQYKMLAVELSSPKPPPARG